MELNWLECIVFGLISGLSEFLPIGSLAHQAVLLKLLGHGLTPVLRVSAYIGSLAALLIFCIPTLTVLYREKRIASLGKKHRHRQPDYQKMMEYRVLKMAAVTMLVLFIGRVLVHDLYERLWLLAIFIGVNGIFLLLPQYLPGANKTAQSLSSLDGLLIGLAAGFGIVPGFSRVGMALSIAQIRGTERRYALELSLLLCVPGLLVELLFQVLAALGTALTLPILACCLAVAIAAFVAAYFGIFLMRCLSVKVGYSGFAYYCWGAALFTLIIYLI